MERINNIHRKNEEYAQKAEEELEKSLKKNNNFDRHLSQKKRAVSEKNKEKSYVIEENQRIFEEKLKNYINTYG